jgi:hypothetical protein
MPVGVVEPRNVERLHDVVERSMPEREAIAKRVGHTISAGRATVKHLHSCGTHLGVAFSATVSFFPGTLRKADALYTRNLWVAIFLLSAVALAGLGFFGKSDALRTDAYTADGPDADGMTYTR